MKKVMTMIGAVLFAALIMTSCGEDSEMDKDAKRIAERACELRLIALDMEEGDFEAFTEFTEKMDEFGDVMEEIEAKYDFQVEDEEFEVLIRKHLKDTPCGDVELDDIFDFF